MHRLAMWIPLFTLLQLGACQSAPPSASKPPADPPLVARNHGYALLYSTLDSETRVADVLRIKSPSEEVATLLRDIADFATRGVETLEGFAASDPSLGFDDDGLPEMETRARQAIESTTTGQIVFRSGRNFEFTMLMSQQKALSYISHLAGVLRAEETILDRREGLESIRREGEELTRRTEAIMRTLESERAEDQKTPAEPRRKEIEE